jgi:hypothetical protein
MRKITLLLVISAFVLLTGCELFNGPASTPFSYDYDWVLNLAQQAVADEYGDGYSVCEFRSGYLDREGSLIVEFYHPHWSIIFTNAIDSYISTLVMLDGRVILDEHGRSKTPFDTEYNSANVASWIGQTSELYRKLSNRSDDSIYQLNCDHRRYDGYDSAELYFFDSRRILLGKCYLDMGTGEIISFHTYAY